jgi:NADPH:quinone reductase-like Zn-dependent oxidoreductase
MLAAFVSTPAPKDPLSVLEIGDRPEPEVPDGWTTVQVKAVSLNHHDLFSLRGVGLPGWTGDETLDPKRSLFSELHQGTMAEKVAVPKRNLLPKPAELSFAEAACLPTAWLTAYRMLFVKSGLRPGSTVLVQGASGGVATALIVIGKAAGYRIWVTGRSEEKRAAALALGADQAFESGARLPERVDGVMETVGEATWSHSVKSLKPGGVIVISGATTGFNPGAELNRVYFTQLSVIGSTMGTRDELEDLIRMCAVTGIRPAIDVDLPLTEAREGFARMIDGRTNGKIVFTL